MLWRHQQRTLSRCCKIQLCAAVFILLLEKTLSGTETESAGAAVATKEVCRWEMFNATCPADGIVVMRTALYGRMREGRCLETNYSIGCWKDVLLWVDELCSGRRQCKIDVPNRQLHEIQPCAKDLQTYLEATFECVKVERGAGSCRDSPIAVNQRTSAGYLSNIVTDSTSQGSFGCPWVIVVDRGQRINVTLLDFSVITNSNLDENRCQLYATIKEKNRGVERICGGRIRTRRLYISFSNEIQIIIAKTSDKEHRHFAIKYQAVGCPDVLASDHSWTHRSGDHVTIGCNCTSHAWHLVCRDTVWVGNFGRCQSCQEFQKDPAIYPYGLLFSVVIGVVLGIFIGACLLAVLVISRRRSSSRDDSAHQYYDERIELEKESNFPRTSNQVRDVSATNYSGFVNPTPPTAGAVEHAPVQTLSYALIRDPTQQLPINAHSGEKDAKTTMKLRQTVRPFPVSFGDGPAACYGAHHPCDGGGVRVGVGITLGRLCDSPPVNDGGHQSKLSSASFIADAPVYNDVVSLQ